MSEVGNKLCSCGNTTGEVQNPLGGLCNLEHSVAAIPSPRKRTPHPSGYQLAKAKNTRMLALINAISDQCAAAGPGPQCEDQVAMIRGMIAEWRYNG